MAFYDLDKEQRKALVDRMTQQLQSDFNTPLPWLSGIKSLAYFSDEDTYIRKSAYLVFGRLFNTFPEWRSTILQILEILSTNSDFRVRQTVMNAAGEIAKTDFK